ncbi:MAG TPA: 50S ribosomal protein L22 [Fimbriimonadaceae bacterium]|nr:50S ribosomal protein L22 [Fimbriimonadaceae bacterium]
MEVKAVGKYVRVQPRKVRIIADQVRGRNAVHAAAILRYHTSKGAKMLRKILVSAIANAQENHGLSADTLNIQTIMVDEGPRLKRMQARAMGRGNRIIKKTSHITVVVEDAEAVKAVKPHGTKAKPRPSFASAAKPKKGKKAEEAKVEAATPVETTEDVVATEPEATVEETTAAPVEATEVEASEAPEEEGGAEAEPVEKESTAEAEGAEATTEEENKENS